MAGNADREFQIDPPDAIATRAPEASADRLDGEREAPAERTRQEPHVPGKRKRHPLLESPPPLGRYEEALDYLYGRINYEKIGNAPYHSGNYRLDRMRQLLALLNNPQLDYDIVHVAGTKGKGTTATLIGDCLRACGRQTGLYTSPHLLCLEERIQFQGSNCSPEELVELTNAVRAAAWQLEIRGAGRATFFEMTTAMGLLHFARRGADVVVLEVGLGGRLDSTNVCQPVVCVITSISLDHQAQLGNTLESIAREKAGIIKRGVPVICAVRCDEARGAILKVAARRGAPVRLIDRDFSIEWRPLKHSDESGNLYGEVTYLPAQQLAAESSNSIGRSIWRTRLLGRHQADNIAAAIATIEILRARGWKLPVDKLQVAVCGSQPSARLEIVAGEPISIIDSAHNPASLQAGLMAIAQQFPGRRPTIIFAVSRDKDWRDMLSQLAGSGSSQIILTAYRENPRALPLAQLWDAANTIAGEVDRSLAGPQFKSADSPLEAWRLARSTTGAGDLIYATGSFFLAAELLSAVRHEQCS